MNDKKSEQSKKNSNEDVEDFTKQLTALDNDASIINQLPSYNSKDTDYFINNLHTELDQQKTLNMILDNKNFDKQIHKIKKFIDDNSQNIDSQLEQLKSISSQLQNIVTTNQDLQQNKIDLKELINSPQYISIANKLREIKSEKEKIKHFLQKNGIISLI
tara:strand:- start:318 stop:797 length:480 start_codon:yes stop_codon:yes gene_type:complete